VEIATDWKKQGDNIQTIQKTLDENEGRAVKRHREMAQTIAGCLQHSAAYIQKAVSEEHEEEGHVLHEERRDDGMQQSAGAGIKVDGEEDDVHEEDDVEELTRVMGHQPSFRHTNTKAIDLMDIYMEYYGLSGFEGVPITGGINGLENKHKNAWRSVYCSADNIFFSRMKTMVASLAAHAGEEEGVLSGSLRSKAAEWQPLLSKGGLAGCHKKLQGLGLILKKGSRAKKSAAASS
jgi:hypothetical protein